jgi:hypothetical protein
MGRPVNKKYFGVAGSANIKVRAKIGANAEGDGFIVSQRGTRKFKVTVGANTGICRLVNKSTGALGANEMIINVTTDAGDTVQATKLYNRLAQIEAGTENVAKVKWNFSASTTDGAVQVADAKAVITIGTQPADITVDLADDSTATFTVVATVLPARTLSYQWQKQEGGAGAWANITGATSASYTTGELTIADDSGDKYRVVVSAADADSVTSDAAELTVIDTD